MSAETAPTPITVTFDLAELPPGKLIPPLVEAIADADQAGSWRLARALRSLGQALLAAEREQGAALPLPDPAELPPLPENDCPNCRLIAFDLTGRITGDELVCPTCRARIRVQFMDSAPAQLTIVATQPQTFARKSSRRKRP